MMEFSQALEKLHESEEFRDWKKSHSGSILTYAFMMVSEDVKKEWQIGYYNKDTDKISTFSVLKTTHKNPDSEMLKGDGVKELDLGKVKVGHKEALKIAAKLQEKEYPEHKAEKKMLILQKISIGQIWNITYVTRTLKTLNIKIDSETGEVLKHDLLELFNFQK